jgi:hypothetical protein
VWPPEAQGDAEDKADSSNGGNGLQRIGVGELLSAGARAGEHLAADLLEALGSLISPLVEAVGGLMPGIFDLLLDLLHVARSTIKLFACDLIGAFEGIGCRRENEGLSGGAADQFEAAADLAPGIADGAADALGGTGHGAIAAFDGKGRIRLRLRFAGGAGFRGETAQGFASSSLPGELLGGR